MVAIIALKIEKKYYRNVEILVPISEGEKKRATQRERERVRLRDGGKEKDIVRRR